MAHRAYEDGLKHAQELASKAVSVESSLSSLSPLVSPLPTLHKSFPLYISAAEAYSYLLSSSSVPESEKAQIKRKWRLVLERAEKVKKRIESLGGNVGRALMTDEGEEREITQRGGSINGVAAQLWEEPTLKQFTSGVAFKDEHQPELTEEAAKLDVRWHGQSDANWTARAAKEERWVVQQGLGADCSVVAALSACTEHNRRWGAKLAEERLYPRATTGGCSKSENGKHIVKLLLNGSWRSVIIDALLPHASSDDKPLYPSMRKLGSSSRSAQASHPHPWMPLVSKAYFKVHGGYSMRGSNPSTDIYELAGWIPESLNLSDRFRREKEWNRLYASWQRGHVLVTLGTGEKVGVGLVPLHAYAVLDIREEDGERLVEVYDPGVGEEARSSASDLPGDLSNGMESLALHARSSPCGRTLMTWDQICSDFEYLNLNWNPQLASACAKRHWTWKKPVSVLGDQAESSETAPRYRLTVSGAIKDADEVWILLSQHVMSKDRSLDDIALRVVDEHTITTGRHDALLHPHKAHDHVPFSNSVHTLYRHTVRRDSTSLLVFPTRDRGIFRTDFTLQAFAPSQLSVNLERISRMLAFTTIVDGELTKRNSGGHPGWPGWVDCPQYALKLSPGNNGQKSGQVRVTLTGAGDMAWNVKLLWGQGHLVTDLTQELVLVDSGSYSHATAFLDNSAVQGEHAFHRGESALTLPSVGNYTLSVSAFEPGQLGKYRMVVESDLPVSAQPIPQEGAGMYSRVVTRRWTEQTAGGRPSGGAYDVNPRIEVVLPLPCTLMSRLFTVLPPASPMPLNLTMFKRVSGGQLGDQVATSGPYSDTLSGVRLGRTKLEAGIYVLVPSAWEAGMGIRQEWELRIWADRALEVEVPR